MKTINEKLRERRKHSAIPTDENGNLVLENPHKISGKKTRENGFIGRFGKSKHKDGSTEKGTYIQYYVGAKPVQNDAEVGDD
jgi:hypothetical protein